MTIEQLKNKADEMGYKVPAHATRGTILRIIREQGGMGPESLMTFGEVLREEVQRDPSIVPGWAVREVSSNDNPSEQLVMCANWWQGELFRMEKEDANRASSSVRTPNYMDPETHASIPYTDETGSPFGRDTARGQSEGPTATRRSATAAMGPEKVSMDQEVPEEVIDEVLNLEARLAALRDHHGIRSPELELRTPGGHHYEEEDEEVFYECESHVRM